MLRSNKIKFSIVILSALCVIVLSNCISNYAEPDLRGPLYAGSQTCRKCHQQVYDSYVQTAHFNTSSHSLPPVVQAAFEKGKNVFRFNDSTEVIMEKLDSQYYQSYVRNGRKLFSHPFDIIVGSGRKAQT